MKGNRWLWLFSLNLVIVAGVIVRDYNYVDFKEFDTLQQLLDENVDQTSGEFYNNILLGVADTECMEKLSAPAFRGVQRHGSGGVLFPRSLPKNEFPVQLEHCAQLLLYRKGDSLEHWSAEFHDFNHPALNSWIPTITYTEVVEFSNEFPFAIQLYWHEENNDPLPQYVLQPGESTQLNSHLGHIFSASILHPEEMPEDFAFAAKKSNAPVEKNFDSPAYANVVDYMVVDDKKHSFKPGNRLLVCEVNELPSATTYTYSPSHTIDCQDMTLRLIEFTHRVWFHQRLALNYIQPQLVRPVTENGFELRKLPPSTYFWLLNWYKEKQALAEQNEGGVGPCMNQQYAPTGITLINEDMKEQLTRELQPILEAWYGKGPIKRTSIYGIRRYYNNSVLRMHVDTANTHVVSAIMNVDQKVDKPWPLIILDHDDNEHKVMMQPGDMLLYESAKLLHGRPEPMVGEHYDNIFIHFMPTEGWDYHWL